MTRGEEIHALVQACKRAERKLADAKRDGRDASAERSEFRAARKRLADSLRVLEYVMTIPPTGELEVGR